MESPHYPKRNPWPSWWSRHELTLLVAGAAINYVMYMAWVADQPAIPPLIAAIGAGITAAVRIWLEERAYRARLPRIRRALQRTGLAVGRLVRQRILFRDFPGHTRDLTTSIIELARGEGPIPEWSPAETTRIREAIENLLAAFGAETGRQVAVLPPLVAKRLDAIDDELDSSAEKLLNVAHIADDIVAASWRGDDERVAELRTNRASAVAAALEPLQRAVAECEWLIGAADA